MVTKIYKYIAISVLFAMIGTGVGMKINPSFFSIWTLVGSLIVEIGIIFYMYKVKDDESKSLIALNTFTFISGLFLTPLITKALGVNPAIVLNAFLATFVALVTLSFYAKNTNTDFSGMGKYLLIGLVIAIVLGISNIWIQSPILHLALAGFTAILFSFYIVYDTQRILSGNYTSPALAALDMYLNIVNLFISLIQIFTALDNDD